MKEAKRQQVVEEFEKQERPLNKNETELLNFLTENDSTSSVQFPAYVNFVLIHGAECDRDEYLMGQVDLIKAKESPPPGFGIYGESDLRIVENKIAILELKRTYNRINHEDYSKAGGKITELYDLMFDTLQEENKNTREGDSEQIPRSLAHFYDRQEIQERLWDLAYLARDILNAQSNPQ